MSNYIYWEPYKIHRPKEAFLELSQGSQLSIIKDMLLRLDSYHLVMLERMVYKEIESRLDNSSKTPNMVELEYYLDKLHKEIDAGFVENVYQICAK